MGMDLHLLEMNKRFEKLPFDFILSADGKATSTVLAAGCKTFNDVCLLIANLPYTRNKNPTDIISPVTEGCGTCSTKHTLLKKVAEEHGITSIVLVIGVFLMNKINTPKVASILDQYHLKGLPEAHCYLSFNNEIYDFTFAEFQLNFKDQLILQKHFYADGIAVKKVQLHKQVIQNWIIENHIPYNTEELWTIREKCIAALSK